MRGTKRDKMDEIKRGMNTEDGLYAIQKKDTASFEDEPKEKAEIA